MAIKPPAWCTAAVPTLRGWETPDGSELLVSRKHTQAEIDAYNGIPVASPKPVVEQKVSEPEMLNEAPMNNVSLEKMTKTQLVALGEQLNLELKPSWTKQTILDKIHEVLS
jgi:hypothetical protein